ncbi:TetR/AcrR family transcriptional regulator [Streptomyces nigra]|uniref:TetR/AcrR family transcriptional regulator n=1 Tax=Streptomyces nigra TaxID=1827580 RepID=UPI0036B551EE
MRHGRTQTHGLRGVGIDQVLERSGVAKSTLYVQFRHEEELIAAYLRTTDDSWMAQLQEAAARAGDGPRDHCTPDGVRRG